MYDIINAEDNDRGALATSEVSRRLSPDIYFRFALARVPQQGSERHTVGLCHAALYVYSFTPS